MNSSSANDPFKIVGADSSRMFPFVISYDNLAEIIRRDCLLQAPAGRNGFVRIEDGHFTTNNGRIRFFATNLTGSASFSSHEYSNRLANRLASFGINCVRLHYFDADYATFAMPPERGIMAENPRPGAMLDPDQLEKFDYLVSVLKNHGIYVNMNLHVARVLKDEVGVTAPQARLEKSVGLFNPTMIQAQKDYASELLLHVNPYTGNAYVNEPAMAMVEINNENSLAGLNDNGWVGGWLENATDKDMRILQELYDSWRNEKGLPPIPATRKYSKEDAPPDFLDFLLATEEKYFLEMYHFLKDDLLVRVPISGTQLCYSPESIQSKLDYLDQHGYFTHPFPMTAEWKFNNECIIRFNDSTIEHMASGRKAGMPYTVSEYNHPYPNFQGAEGIPLLSAYAALLDWDGIFSYSYNNRKDSEPGFVEYFFSFVARTDCLAHFPACANLFLRSDVSVDVGDQRIHPNTQQGPIWWSNWCSHSAFWKLDTPNTKVFTGFPAGRTIPFENISLTIGESILNWCTISITSQSNNGFGENGQPTKILIAATGFTCNSDAEFEYTFNGFMHQKNNKWGHAPILTEGIAAKITLPSLPSRVKAFSLDENGTRKEQLTLLPSENNTTSIMLSPDFKTIWYEVEIN